MHKKSIILSTIVLSMAMVCNNSYGYDSSTERIVEEKENVIVIDSGPDTAEPNILINPSVDISDNGEIAITTTIPEPSVEVQPEEMPEPEPTIEELTGLTDDEINLIALVTMAEAEGESEQGKRLVIDTILNRVDSSEFPNTVHGVVYQKGHFSSMWNGRVDKCYVTDSIRQLVIEEAQSRTNHDVMYFTAGKYSKYGTPMFKVGNHCFSSI